MKTVRSPLMKFYTGKDVQAKEPELFYETVSHLTVLRAKLREYQATREFALTLGDLLEFVAMYEEADERMINTSPYNQQTDAVQLMTVYKAKGLEYQYVFLVGCQDEIWGSTSRGSTNRITLPQNLSPIRYAGDSENERLRLLFVAVTRAKYGLYLLSASQNYTGKATKHLKYFNELEQTDGSFKAMVLPERYQTVIVTDYIRPALPLLQLDWQSRHLESGLQAKLPAILQDRIDNYRLNPTHLNIFTDLVYGGPHALFFTALLRFPSAPTVNGQFGSAVHETMEWIQQQLNKTSELPLEEAALGHFEQRLKQKKLTHEQLKLETRRGNYAISHYLKSRGHTFRQGSRPEFNFFQESVFMDDVRLTGKIDLLEIDEQNKSIVIVDYKTGASHSAWKQDARLHRYKQQLYFYKILVENSRTFQNYTVTGGRLEFVEPDSNDDIHYLELKFDEAEEDNIRGLIKVVWTAINRLDFPDVSNYSKDLKGIQAFEAGLIATQ